MTTAPRDSNLQESVRLQTWPFDRVHVMFWDDISLELSGHDDLLQKHFPGWMKKTTTEEQVLNMVLSSEPEDFNYNDSTGVFFDKSDVSLRIIFSEAKTWREVLRDAGDGFLRPSWHPTACLIYYGQNNILEVPCVYVDGGRHVIRLHRV